MEYYTPYGSNPFTYDHLVDSEDPNLRRMAAEKGYGLDKLIQKEQDKYVLATIAAHCNNAPDIVDKLVNNDNWEVRAALVRHNNLSEYSLGLLVNDEDWHVREAIAQKGYALDVYVTDDCEYVRKQVAEWRYGLDTLVNDTSETVQLAVLRQGYGYEQLKNSNDLLVYQTAHKVASQMENNEFFVHTMKKGDKEYGLTNSQCKALEGAIYWSHCERLDNIEVDRLQEQVTELAYKHQTDMIPNNEASYIKQRLQQARDTVKEDELSLRDCMTKMQDEFKIPNWIGNAAIQWAKENDLRIHYMSDFFTKSKYAVTEKQQSKTNHQAVSKE